MFRGITSILRYLIFTPDLSSSYQGSGALTLILVLYNVGLCIFSSHIIGISVFSDGVESVY